MAVSNVFTLQDFFVVSESMALSDSFFLLDKLYLAVPVKPFRVLPVMGKNDAYSVSVTVPMFLIDRFSVLKSNPASNQLSGKLARPPGSALSALKVDPISDGSA